MKKNILVQILWILLIASTCISLSWAKDQSVNYVGIVGARSLHYALEVLSQQLGCSITYEDPKYESMSVMQQYYPNGPIVPRSHRIMFNYIKNPNLDDTTVIQALLNQYNMLDPGSIFTVSRSSEDKNIYNVIPTESTNASGKRSVQSSPLDMVISISAKGTYEDIEKQIVKLIPNSSLTEHVTPLALSYTHFDSMMTSLDVQQETVRVALDRLLKQYDTDISNASHNKQAKNSQIGSWILSHGWKDSYNLFYDSYDTSVEPSQKDGNTVSLEIEELRPLEEAMKLISQRFDEPIIYEDAPWSCSCEVLENESGKPEVPRGGSIQFAFSLAEDHIQILKDCVQAYEVQGNPAQFAAKEKNGALLVYPTQSMNRDGSPNIIKISMLDHAVSFSSMGVSASNIVQSLCTSLMTLTKKKVVVGKLPDTFMSVQPLSYAIKDKPVDTALLEINKLLGKNFSWELLFDPHNQEYILNAYDPQASQTASTT